MAPFAAVVDAGPDVSVSAVDFQDAFRQLPELISAEFDARKRHARSLLKIPTSANSPSCSPPEQLDLAIAVFTCNEMSCREPCLFGWDDIAQHHCKLDFELNNNRYWMIHRDDYKPGSPKVGFNAPGSEITAAVVRAAGLNDKVATASDMDARTKNIRFKCSLCPPVKRNGTWRASGYDWRRLVRFLLSEYYFFFFDSNTIFFLGITLCYQVTFPQGRLLRWPPSS